MQTISVPQTILDRPNKDHHGFYTVGDFKTYSKLEAIELSVRLGQPVIWNYNKSVFEKIDWTQEPPGSLDLYYRQRALQLREKYDYLVLWYSGGSDSHNVLMSFVKNNIFVDEIVQYHQLEAANGDKKFSCNLEQFATSIPITQSLIENNPLYKNTVHRVIDFTEYKIQLFTDKQILDKWWYNQNDFYSVQGCAVSNIKSLHPAYRQIRDSGKKFCFVWGADKPVMSMDQQYQLNFSFLDASFSTMINPDRKISNESWDHDELFYWTPDFPELPVKQAHVIKNYIDKFTGRHADGHFVKKGKITNDQYGQYQDMINLPYCVFWKNNQCYTMMLDGARKLLYPYWNPNSIVKPITPSTFFSDNDVGFLNTNAPVQESRQIYLKGLVHLKQWMQKNAPQYWYEHKYDPKVAPFKGGMKLFYNSYSLARSNQ